MTRAIIIRVKYLQFYTDGSVHASSSASDAAWTGIASVSHTYNGVDFVLTGVATDEDIVRGTLVSNVVVSNLMGEGFTGDVTFAAGTVIIFDAADENIRSGTLTGDVGTDPTIFRRINDVNYVFITITGDPITEGTITGGVRYFRAIGGVTYVFSSVETDGDGVLAEEKTVLIDSNAYTFASNKEIAFYSDGSVKQGYLASNHAVTQNGIEYTFRGGSFLISFYDSGAVKRGVLATDSPAVTLNGVEYTFWASTGVSFYANGAVSNGFLASTSPAVTLNEVAYTFNKVYFTMEGIVIQGELASGVDVDDDGTDDYKQDQYLQFYTNGIVHASSVALDVAWTGIASYIYNGVEFFLTGVATNEGIVRGTLVSNVVVMGLTGEGFAGDVTFKAGTEFTFDANADGVILSGTLDDVDGMEATHFRRINDVNYVFITITPSNAATGDEITEGTFMDGENTVTRYFRTIGEVDYVFSMDTNTNGTGTLASNVVVMGLTGEGFTGDVTFKADTVITFDADNNILSGMLIGVDGTDATHFRRINDVNYVFITITGDPITEGTITGGARYFRTFGGVHYVFSSVETNADGDIISGVLVEEKTVPIGDMEYTFASNEAISFHPDESVELGTLAAAKMVTVGDMEYTFASNEKISFYLDGSVEWGDLALNSPAVTLNRIAYTFNRVYFAMNGIVIQGRLASNVDVDEDGTDDYNQGQYLQFYTNGIVHANSAESDATWTGLIPSYPYNGVEFFLTGVATNEGIVRGTLASNVIVSSLTGTGFTGDVTFKAGTEITFDAADENILSGTLTGDVGTDPTIFRRINDVNYVFITTTGDPITEGTITGGAR